MLKMLDCFCGLGGVSDGFSLEGFDATGIDIDEMPKYGYKHKFIQVDIRKAWGYNYQGYDVIWGSPPCRNFVTMSDWHWKDKKNPGEGLVLVNAFLDFVRKASPHFWIMENVKGLTKYIDDKPRQISWIGTPKKRRAFWGNYPNFLMPIQSMEQSCEDMGKAFDYTNMRRWIRAKIPLACSQAFARACKDALLKPEKGDSDKEADEKVAEIEEEMKF